MHVLITGAAGFVGSRLARHLLEQGDRVSGTYLDVKPDLEGVDLYEADLQDRAALERAVREASPDAVVNLAGLSHIGESWEWERMPDYFWVNVVGTENVVAAAAGRPVVIVSSADVYGMVPREEQPISEERRIIPQTPYALTKAAAERIALAQGAIVVRSFNLVGPGQVPKFALAGWAAKLAEIRRGEREPVRMRTALDRLQEISGVQAEVKEGVFPPRPFDIPYLSGDASRLRALGWEPRRTLDDALRDLWESLR
jgi:GDP-4-dehydro-6-deoxy-D-mannose reductase